MISHSYGVHHFRSTLPKFLTLPLREVELGEWPEDAIKGGSPSFIVRISENVGGQNLKNWIARKLEGVACSYLVRLQY